MSLWQDLRLKLRNPLSRAGLGLFAMATGAVSLWPPAGTQFAPDKALAFAVALCAWLYAELFADEQQSHENKSQHLSQHDLELADLVAGLASDGFIAFLKGHDFGGSWRKAWADPVYDLAHLLESPRSTFNDEVLQEQLIKVKEADQLLAKHLALWGGPLKGVDLFSMIPDIERARDQWSARTNERIEKVNTQADLLASEIECLFSMLRKLGYNLLKTSKSPDSQ